LLISVCSFPGSSIPVAHPGRDLSPVRHVELGEDVLDVVLGRPLGHVQAFGNRRIFPIVATGG
jgi:hypothetical protein